ncbi:glycosyltransferase [Verrucomicrobiota bacterium]
MSGEPITTVSVIAGLADSDGGPSVVLPSLSEALAKRGVLRYLIVPAEREGIAQCVPDKSLVNTIFVRGFRLRMIGLALAPYFRRTLVQCCEQNNVQLIHCHGVWMPVNHEAACVARDLNIPFIVTLDGMLRPWALRYKSWKKRIAWLLYQNRDLHVAKVLHATAFEEAAEIRSMGFNQPIAVIPNGTMLPPPQVSRAHEEYRYALFLGRICPAKGLINLVKAWAKLKPKGWRCLITGPSEGVYEKLIRRVIKKEGLDNCFEFSGLVDGVAKWQLIKNAAFLVLPSVTENFGIVVAESLACRTPVIATKATPWEDLVLENCGWWVDGDSASLGKAMSEAMAMSGRQRHGMGERGERLVRSKYSWDRVAEQMHSVYEWMLDKKDAIPSCLHFSGKDDKCR